MRKYRTIGEVEEEYLRNHPDEIDDYINVLFDEYAESGDTQSLLSSLRSIGRVNGTIDLTAIAELSHQDNLQFGSVNAIVKSMGYRLMPQKLPQPNSAKY
jgi:DNA-binding phage protein